MSSTPSSAAATAAIIAVLERHTGQQIGANRAWRIETALKPLLRAKGMASLDQLAMELKARRDPALPAEIAEALLNHETSFFRDGGVLAQLVEATVALSEATPGRRMRIWSIGCSTGQEPLSLAMLFTQAEREGRLEFPEIIATDVSKHAVARAKSGRYTQFEIQRGLPMRQMIDWFDSDGSEWTAKPELMARIRFRQHNISRVNDPMLPGKFDVILCRNVLMYFAAPLRTDVLARMATVMQPESVLVLGAGETVIGQTDHLAPSARFRGLYQLR